MRNTLHMLCIIIAYLPSALLAQEGNALVQQNAGHEKGIKWVTAMSWSDVKAKAKRENKYIFLDCFTTWCKPCHMMDKEVYINEIVGQFVNDKFISVKVQIDKTKNDNAYIQSWYKDAIEIRTHYLLESFPTYLFFNPAGEIIHKETGYQKADKFITIIQSALTPGKKWNDDYVEYIQLLDSYKQGIIKYDRLPFMAAIAKKQADTISREFVHTHENYMSSLPAKKRYTNESITFWSDLNLNTDRKIIRFFYRDAKKIDNVMQQKGYSQKQVDRSIQNFIVAPFINEQLKNPDAKSGLALFDMEFGTIASKEPCYDEADWVKLYQLIRKDFDENYAKRNLLKAKALWYEKNSNWLPYAKFSLENLKANPPDFTDKKTSLIINDICWNIFFRVTNKKLINESIPWMEKAVQTWNYSNLMDTYANLLYKAGRKEEAIQWQEKAVNLTPKNKPFKLALEQMKKGEPTYKAAWDITK